MVIANGGLVAMNPTDTYDVETGAGSYQVLISDTDGKAYFGGGVATLDSAGMTLTADLVVAATYAGTGDLYAINDIVLVTGDASTVKGIQIATTKQSGAGAIAGLYGLDANATTADTAAHTVFDLVGVKGEARTNHANATVDFVTGVYGLGRSTAGSGGEIVGVKAAAIRTAGTWTTTKALHVVPGDGATTDYGIFIDALAANANNYAIYSSAAAQSLFAGTITSNVGLTNGSAAFDAPGTFPGIILRADSATKQRADIRRTTTALAIGVRDSNAIPTSAIVITDAAGAAAGAVSIPSMAGTTIWAESSSGTALLAMSNTNATTGHVLSLTSSGTGSGTEVLKVQTDALLVRGDKGVIIGPATAGTIGFYGAAPVAKPTVTGSRAGNAALADLLAELATLGLITNSSTA